MHVAPATAAVAAATPSPTPSTPSPSPTSPAEVITTTATTFWDWFTGAPLTIILVLVISGLVLAVLRAIIHRTADQVAKGVSKKDGVVSEALSRTTSTISSERRAQRARTLGTVLSSAATIVVGTIAALLILDELGVNIGPFVASAGVVGVALGFGAQSLIKDFLSGTFMLMEDQYGVGDVVDFAMATGAGTVSGVVEDVTLRITKLRDEDGTVWYLRNGDMARVGNRTQEWATAVVPVVVARGSDLDAALGAVNRAVTTVAKDKVTAHALLEPARTTVADAVTVDGVTLTVRVRTRSAQQWDVERGLRVALLDELDGVGITLVSA